MAEVVQKGIDKTIVVGTRNDESVRKAVNEKVFGHDRR